MEDVLHVHSGHDGSRNGSEVTDQLCSLLLPGVVQEPRLHLVEVLAGVQLHEGKGDAGSLLDPCHQHPLMVLHQEIFLEAGLLHLLAGGR